MSRLVEQGFERDRLSTRGLDLRWWLFVHLDGEDGRPQRPRKGVEDNGFTFARGGRARSEEEARRALEDARAEAVTELGYWRGQPSHALGDRGELVALGLQELPA